MCWREDGEKTADHGHISAFSNFTCLYPGRFPDELHHTDKYLLKVLLAANKKAMTKPHNNLVITSVNNLHTGKS